MRRDNFVAGFSVALGVAALMLLLFLGWRLLGALSAMITPFIIALVLALLLDPVADFLETRLPISHTGRRRLVSVVIVFLGLLLFLAGLVAFIVPTLIAQTSRLITFFAPLSYKVERSRPDGRFVIVEKEASGTSYLVKNLQNGQPYLFRVIARDANGRQYVLKSVKATPKSAIVHKETDTRDSAEVQQAAKSAEKDTTDSNRDSTVDSPANISDTSDANTLPTSTPRPMTTPTPGILSLPRLVPTPAPSPSLPTEEGDEGADSILPAVTLFSNPDEKNGDVDETRYTTAGEIEAAGTPMPVASPVLREDTTSDGIDPPSPLPIATPTGATGAVMASPRPLASVTAGAILPRVSPSPVATVAPTPRPTAIPRPSHRPHTTPAPVSTATPSNDILSSKNARASDPHNNSPKLPPPGIVFATSGDGRVRLQWRPPVTAASGFDRLRSQADQWLVEHRSVGPLRLPPNLAAIQAEYSAQASQLLQQASRRAADIIVGSISTALTIALSLIIGFYLLMDFDRLRMRFFHLLPSEARGGVLQTITDVGAVFGSYVRGMSSIAAVYGLVAIVLFFGLGTIFNMGLRSYALLLGVMAGVLYPIPFLGPITTTLVATAVALATGATPVAAIVVLVVVQVQNFIFDNLVVPRVVGKSVGLHPLVTIFALLLGGQLFGLLGMLLSVPIAASIQKLLIRLYPHLGEATPMVVQHPDGRGGIEITANKEE